MAHEFNMGLSSQEEWAWLVAIDLFLGGSGGGLFLLYMFFDLSPSTALFSLALVILGAVVLLCELGHPLRAWRAIARPRTSWISRGVIFVTLFIIIGFLSIAPSFSALSGLLWSPSSLGGKTLGVIAGISASMVILYPGFVLAASPAIPFWNSPLLPVLFFFQALLGASGIILLFSPLDLYGPVFPALSSLVALLIVINFVLVSIHLLALRRSGLPGRESVRLLNHGFLGWTFGGGVLLLGMVLPLIIGLWFPSLVVVAGVFILIGTLLYRYCVLKAGVYVPFPST
ncbi:MAG: DmsC/YnfH family molybdoenzyme membrane anchor subunit [Candidatus Binatia bacterium]